MGNVYGHSEADETRVSREFLRERVLSLELVSAFAGDRELSDAERQFIENYGRENAATFYADLLYAITHHRFQNQDAEDVWNQILRHKFDMSVVLGRNVRIAVASLDYLANLKGELRSTTLIDESSIVAIVGEALLDGLTRLFNHAACFEKAMAEISRFQRYSTDLSVMMIDIDNFKKINDRFGHLEGDRILTALGAIMREETRDSDICCRYGGEEFAIILPETDLRETCTLAERLRARVERTLPLGRKVTISIGVASCDRTITDAQMLFEKADTALYRAKRSRKNRVVAMTDSGDLLDVERKRDVWTGLP